MSVYSYISVDIPGQEAGRMTGSDSMERIPPYVGRKRAPCKRCGEKIDADVAACSHCGNQPMAGLKRASIVSMFIGSILTFTAGNVALASWFGPVVGAGLLCGGAAVYWIVTGRYSPTEYDSRARAVPHGSESAGH